MPPLETEKNVQMSLVRKTSGTSSPPLGQDRWQGGGTGGRGAELGRLQVGRLSDSLQDYSVIRTVSSGKGWQFVKDHP